MKRTAMMWYAGALLATLAMQAAPATATAQQRARKEQPRAAPDSTRA